MSKFKVFIIGGKSNKFDKFCNQEEKKKILTSVKDLNFCSLLRSIFPKKINTTAITYKEKSSGK